MTRAAHIVILPGDGIGPEIMAPTVELLRRLGSFEFEEHRFGGASIDAHGVPLTDEVLAAARRADAVLLGAVGDPALDQAPWHLRPETGLLALRTLLGVFANLRPVSVLPTGGALCGPSSIGGRGTASTSLTRPQHFATGSSRVSIHCRR